MGWKREDLTPGIVKGMSAEDQARYGPGIHPPFAEDHHPVPVNDSLERDEQRSFCNWCLLHGYRPVWHATHKRSTANRGCPDFIVAVKGVTFWIEFKRPGFDLSIDQRTFRDELAHNGITLYVVYSALEAIELIKQHDPYSSLEAIEGINWLDPT